MKHKIQGHRAQDSSYPRKTFWPHMFSTRLCEHYEVDESTLPPVRSKDFHIKPKPPPMPYDFALHDLELPQAVLPPRLFPACRLQ